VTDVSGLTPIAEYSTTCVGSALTGNSLNGMEYEEDDYSDRDASGEDDTDYIDANLAERADGVALDPALSQNHPDPHDVGYPDVTADAGEYVEETGGQVISYKCSAFHVLMLTPSLVS